MRLLVILNSTILLCQARREWGVKLITTEIWKLNYEYNSLLLPDMLVEFTRKTQKSRKSCSCSSNLTIHGILQKEVMKSKKKKKYYEYKVMKSKTILSINNP